MNISSKSEEEVLEIVSQNFKHLKFVNSELKKNKDFVLKVIDLMEDSYGRLFSYVPKHFNNDKDIALKLVKLDGMVLEGISPKLQNDEEIVREAISNNPYAAMFANERLLDNKALALIAVKKEGDTLSYFSDKLRADKEVVFEAVKNNGEALRYASTELKKDKGIAITAINSSKNAIISVPNELFEDNEVALAALKQDSTAFIYFPKDLFKNIQSLSLEEKIKHLENLIMKQQLEDELSIQDIKQKKLKI